MDKHDLVEWACEWTEAQAEKRYGKEFEELSDETQDGLWLEAQSEFFEGCDYEDRDVVFDTDSNDTIGSRQEHFCN